VATMFDPDPQRILSWRCFVNDTLEMAAEPMWNRPTFGIYYQSIDRIVRELLDKESPDDLLRIDFNEYLDYLVSRCEWQPLEWYEDDMTIERFTVGVSTLRKSLLDGLPLPASHLASVPGSTPIRLAIFFWLRPRIVLVIPNCSAKERASVLNGAYPRKSMIAGR
jgi:hypothetical protein